MILKNAKIVLENKIIENGWIEIVDQRIKSINESTAPDQGIDLKGNWVLPGFIDCHVHGGYGVDFETGTIEGFKEFSKNVSKEGVTRYYQASVTNDVEKNNKLYKTFGKFMKNHNNVGSKCMGAHMEGPFISSFKKGAHDPKLLLKPNINLTNQWNKLSNNNLKIVTYAPELQDGSYTTWLIKNGILPSAGHSDISAKEFERDYGLGIRHVTHLFNAMSGIDQHKPGLVVEALIHKDILCEVISDGIHIQPEVLKLIFNMKTANEICIVTDAMNAKGLKDGNYKLGDLPVYKKGIEIRLTSNNALAGAGATYDHNVRYYKKVCNIKMNDLIKMTSINIAKQMNIFDKTGSLESNKLADIVIMDKDLHVKTTIVEGKVVFDNNEY